MNKLKLNLGCGAIRPDGWLNMDSSFNSLLQRLPFGKFLARSFGSNEYETSAHYINLNRKWRFKSSSVSVVYASHLFEHLKPLRAKSFLDEANRCLCREGSIRIVVPDLIRMQEVT